MSGVSTTDDFGGPKFKILSSLCIFSNFPILCINPFPRHRAGGPGWLPDTVEVCETNNWKELNLNRSNSRIINWICQCVPEVCQCVGFWGPRNHLWPQRKMHKVQKTYLNEKGKKGCMAIQMHKNATEFTIKRHVFT